MFTCETSAVSSCRMSLVTFINKYCLNSFLSLRIKPLCKNKSYLNKSYRRHFSRRWLCLLFICVCQFKTLDFFQCFLLWSGPLHRHPLQPLRNMRQRHGGQNQTRPMTEKLCPRDRKVENHRNGTTTIVNSNRTKCVISWNSKLDKMREALEIPRLR